MSDKTLVSESASADPTSERLLAEANCRTAEGNREHFLAAIPPELAEREDAIPRLLAQDNASAFSKLRKLYRLLNELGDVAKPYIACGKGCSACCHMNVMVSQLEVALIEKEVGARPMSLNSSRIHDLATYSGVPCPFLKEDVCSIYEARPFACRTHMNFDSTAYWCAPERSNQVGMPLVKYSCAEKAYLELARTWKGGLFADIRDFFPS